MATFTGTNANEVIRPTFVSPTVATNGGATPGVGADIINAGGGNDTLDGGGGADQLFGELGDDRLVWNSGGGSDLFEGGDGTDTAEVNGGAGGETFNIAANVARVDFDRLSTDPFSLDIGTTERLVVNMGAGNDVISTSGNLAALILITIDGGAGNDTILGSNGIDTLLGGIGNDFIDGQQGNDVAFLGDGNDSFQWDPGDGSDTIEGQAGTDTLLFNGSAGNEDFAVSANGQRALFTRNLGNIIMDINDVERITLNALGGLDDLVVDDLTGTDIAQINVNLAATIGGAFGDLATDTVIVNGSASANNLSVSTTENLARVNVLVSETANDTITVNGLAGNDTIEAGGFLRTITIDGGTETDTVSYLQASARVEVSLLNPGSNVGAAVGHAYVSIESATGSAFDDFLTGDNGNNVLNGGGADDYLAGLDGDDTYVVDRASDVIIERVGQGNDTVVASASYTLSGPARVEVVSTTNINGAAAINLTGNDFAQTITGNRGANKLDGRGGSDTLIGGLGNDTLTGGLGVDTLRGEGGNDTYVLENGADNVIDTSGTDTATSTITRALAGAYAEIENLTLLGNALTGTGNAFANTISGNAKNNALDGGTNNDTLQGLAGNDILIGGAGRDTHTGGTGSDTFRFLNKAHSFGANTDTINDFDDGGTGDRIDVSALFGPAIAYIHSAAFSAAGQVRINDVAGADVIVEVNTGGSLAADFQLRLKATTLASMGADDFVL